MAGRRVFTRGVTSSSFCPLAHAARRAGRGSPGASQGAPPVPLVAKWTVLTRSKRTGVSYDVAVTVVPTAEGDAPTPPLAPAGAGPAGSCPSAAAFGAGADSRCGECWTASAVAGASALRRKTNNRRRLHTGLRAVHGAHPRDHWTRALAAGGTRRNATVAEKKRTTPNHPAWGGRKNCDEVTLRVRYVFTSFWLSHYFQSTCRGVATPSAVRWLGRHFWRPPSPWPSMLLPTPSPDPA